MSANTPNKPSGLKQPSKIGKVSGVAKTLPPLNLGSSSNKLPITGTKLANNASVILTENTDDFIIGDRVWVGGTKPGHIQYIGETQFAPGEWAGVVLDEAIGKNDGSVAGVRYFQCEPKRGVFSRLTKLSKDPVQQLIDEEREAQAAIHANGSSSGANSPKLSSGPKLPVKTSPASSSSSLKKVGADPSPHGSMQNLASAREAGLKIGCRVIVHSANGTKNGVLRFLGSTDFAAGEWAGVELEDAVGKNDGSVGGRRYFDCRMKYGLFAPIHKISLAASHSAKKSPSTPRPMVASLGRRTGSHESLNSSISSASSIARAARVRLGITSLTGQKTPQRSPTTSVTATHTALQEALKEKEQHIEQLLKERDMERSEVARAASQVEEAEQKIANMKTDFQRNIDESERHIAKLRENAERTEHQYRDVLIQLEEEKRKTEDLQFRIEEEIISKSDLESVSEADAEKIQQLTQSIQEERKRSERLEQDSQKLFQAEEMIAKLSDELEQAKNRLNSAEQRFKFLESTKDEAQGRMSQTASELLQKATKLHQLEQAVEAKDREINDIRKNTRATEEELEKRGQLIQKLQDSIEALTTKTENLQTSVSNLNNELQSLQLDNSDLQRKLQSSEDRCEQTTQQRTKLEQDMEELMKSKGDSSVQLTKMNELLREREKLYEEVYDQLQVSNQEMARLQDKLIQSQQQAQQQLVDLAEKHDAKSQVLQEEFMNKSADLERSISRSQEMASEREEELKTILSQKDTEIIELKNENQAKQNEVAQLTSQLSSVRIQIEAGLQQQDDFQRNLELQLRELRSERDKVFRERDELQRNYEDLTNKHELLTSQAEKHLKLQREAEATMREKDSKVTLLTAEVDRLRSEFSTHRLDLQRKLAETELEVQTMQEMHNQLEIQNRLIDELQSRLNQAENENEELQASVGKISSLQNQNAELEAAAKKLKKELEDMKQKESEFKILFDSEKQSLQSQIDTNQIVLQQREKEFEERVKEINKLQNQTADLPKLESLLRNSESEREKLQKQLAELQADFEKSKANAVTAESAAESYEDKDSQINFLNSVIVDMQMKNDELQNRIKFLEADPSFKEADINLNGIKSNVVLPRLFCDICDVFDLHDTEDCPRQASSDSPPPSQHHGSRNQIRPYCDICEVFGHWTNQCNDNETF